MTLNIFLFRKNTLLLASENNQTNILILFIGIQ